MATDDGLKKALRGGLDLVQVLPFICEFYKACCLAQKTWCGDWWSTWFYRGLKVWDDMVHCPEDYC